MLKGLNFTIIKRDGNFWFIRLETGNHIFVWIPPCEVLHHIIYECEICGGYHPWTWDGDCREDANRYAGPDEYAERKGIDEDDIEVRTMDERMEADGW